MAVVKPVRFGSAAAARGFARLPADVQAALRGKLELHLEAGGGRAKKLQGRDGSRLRAGDYRVIFEETADEIIIVAAGNRRDVYR